MGQKLHTPAERIAHLLMDIGGVKLAPDEPFRWSSGLVAPIYCDNRLMLSYPEARDQIADAFAHSVDGLAVDAIVGVATAGIAYAALVADRMGLPMAYVRGKPKQHGRRNQIEGTLSEGHRVVLIEDLVSTGGSLMRVENVVRSVTGRDPVLALAIVSYNLSGVAEKFAAANIPLKALTTFDVLMQVGLEERRIRASDVDRLRTWQQDPHAWSAQYDRAQ